MRAWLPLTAVLVLACSDGTAPEPSEREDAGRRDAGARDAQRGVDGAGADADHDADADADYDADHDAGDGDGDAAVANKEDASITPALGVKLISDPPSYLGTDGASTACTRSFRTYGFEPDDAGKHPLFLYFVGTRFLPEDQSPDFSSRATQAVTEAMARRGFVALSAEYDNIFTSFFVTKTQCLFGDPKGLIAEACARPNVDCAQGIATWGHSQGGLLAHRAGDYDERVRAVWATGYGGSADAKLPNSRLRVVNAEADPNGQTLDALNKASGSNCTSGTECLRPDGSGWIQARKADSATNSADHCWFDKKMCAETELTLEPNWIARDSTAPFALEKNADWVAETTKRP